ncbi:rhomboid family intramembrane serine protease [Methylomonas sp. SURF-2]|uniref:Rhomboid family intramembrane serine protease n=1 Tax=Methylomonas subterranea TaxID=2952225 RepID=A0ABT1TDW9_9GAMM|nr:rhomboid family intramembrane serine protease [Methylomonas sp. SURF-2]MCQ8103656.1 rhomboid family intramembrane serine protease [Methylomonas sp. SURF-2]
MIPIRDSIPCNTTPYVSWGIMAICIGVYLVMLLMPDSVAQHFLYMYGMVPFRYSNPTWSQHFGLPPDYYFSFLSSLFLHGGWAHLLVNMMFMWIFADNIEDLMGHRRFAVFYLICGLSATYIQWYFSQNLVVPVVGASGAIAGVLGAYFFRFPYARVVIMVPILFFPLFFEIPAIAFLGVWVILQLQELSTAALFPGMGGNSAWWAHLGGFVVGALIHPWFIDKPVGYRIDVEPREEA